MCDSITGDNGGSNEQSFDSAKQFTWTTEELSKAEVQGFMDVAKKIGSKFEVIIIILLLQALTLISSRCTLQSCL